MSRTSNWNQEAVSAAIERQKARIVETPTVKGSLNLATNERIVYRKIPYKFTIGIDPGDDTGFAIWDVEKKVFHTVDNQVILKSFNDYHVYAAMRFLEKFYSENPDIHVRIENPYSRKWYGNNSASDERGKMFGAGAIKAHYKIWECFLNDLGCSWVDVAPKALPKTKSDKDREFFNLRTGYRGKSNDDARKAGYLAFLDF